jgi:hypothetical protein
MKNRPPFTLRPVSLLKTIRLMEDDWMVIRHYDKNGDDIRICGFGRTKREALLNLDFEVWQESQYS